MMKKILAIILAIIFTLTTGIVAFASDENVKTEIAMPNGASYAANEYKKDTVREDKLWTSGDNTHTDENGVTRRYVHEKNYIVSKDDPNFLYKINDDNTISIVYDYLTEEPQGEIIIPETLDGKTVVKIDAFAFFSCNDVTGIRIPNTVKEIGYAAFSYCSKLERVVIGTGAEKISADAFDNIKNSFDINFVGSESDVDKIVVWSHKKTYAKTHFNWSAICNGKIVFNVDVANLTETTSAPSLIEWFLEYIKTLFEMIKEYYKVVFDDMNLTFEHWFGYAE